MKRFSTYLRPILPLAAALALPLTQGCSDDLFPNGEGGGDAERGVVVYVPKVQPGQQLGGSGRTRGALNDYKANEGDINSLHLFAYPAAGGAAQVFDLLGGDVKSSTSAPKDYEGYVLDLTPGDYRLYVVANVDFTNAASLTEKDLKDYEVKVPKSAEKGLPMSCSNSGMAVSYNGAATYSTVGEQGVNVAGGATVKVKADLKFAVAKVRVTMLNDLRPDLELKSAGLDGMADISSLMTDGSVTATIGSADFMEASYYTLPEMQPDLLDVDVENMEIQAVRPDDGWAWQGTAYVAERLFDADEANPSTVNLTLSDGTEKVLTVGTKGEGLKRSYFYDYVGNSKGEFVVEVQPWDAITIAGALHGPYYLHVDETALTIEAGETTSFWYESNAPIECVSGTYTNADGEEVSIYDFTISDNEITVSVNPQIKGSEIESVKQQDGWKSFVIKAGTIEKRIEIKELDLKEFLTVDVNSVTIDVREQVASGIYSGSFVIPVRTNLEQFKIEYVSWEDAGDAVTLCDPEGNPITDFTITPGQGGVYNLQVSFTGLNDGKDFWQSSRQLQFTVSGTLADGTAVSETVNVNIVASSDDYIIHLYAPGWNAPHVYIYQSLELPSNHSLYPNGIVGNGDGNSGNTAYEYIFSGAVAFRGWNVPYPGDGINYNNPNDALAKNGYVYNFTGGASNDGGWDAGKGPWEHHYYTYDFCEDYRGEMAKYCSQCQNVQIGWPGAVMVKDEETGDGWWKFTLSGLATPGKALMMFTDNHDGSGSRHPQNNEPGIPLFDYPSREGWIDVSASGSKQFSPNAPVPPVTTNVKIYYKGSKNEVPKENTVYLNIDGTRKQMTSTTLAGNSDWWEVSVSVPENASIMRFDSYQNDQWKTANYTNLISDISNYGTTLYYEFQNWNVVRVNAPSEGGGDDDGQVTYRIYWKYNSSSWNGLNFWGSAGTYNGIYDNYPNTKTEIGSNGKFVKYSDSYVYLEFTADKVVTGNFNYQKRNGDTYFDKSENNSFNLFTKDADGVYCYTIDQGSGKPAGSVTPPTPSDEYVTYRIAWPITYDGITRKCIYLQGNNLPSGTKIVRKSGDMDWKDDNYEYEESYGNEAYFYFKIPSNAVNSGWGLKNIWIKKSATDSGNQYNISGDLSVSNFTIQTGSDIPTYKVTNYN